MYEEQWSECYVPPGWPGRVRPPGAPDWEFSAVDFLLDCGPPDYRRFGLLRRHPVVLAMFAEVFVGAQVQASAEGLAGLRVGLAGAVAPEVVAEAVEVWSTQQAALARLRREVALVADALRGRRFVPRLQ